jgi:asparagine synthase (glutamine-hydrolysing)
LFGSELKALRAHPAFRAEVDRNALALLLRHNYIPAPYPFIGHFQLSPGCLLTVSLSQRNPQIVPYWSGKQAIAGLAIRLRGSDSAAVSALEALLKTPSACRWLLMCRWARSFLAGWIPPPWWR